jgi:hypothetical protein
VPRLTDSWPAVLDMTSNAISPAVESVQGVIEQRRKPSDPDPGSAVGLKFYSLASKMTQSLEET